MYFRILTDEATGLMSYLLADLDTQQAIVIDPRLADMPVLHAMLQEHRLVLKAMLLTHVHPCDQAAPSQLSQALGAPLYMGEQLEEGALIAFGDEHVRVVATPGHTAHCRSFLWRDRLFCGGLLAADACPHSPLVQQPQALWDTVMRKVFTLPPETLLFSAHAGAAGAVSHVLAQRRHHPWFAGHSRDDFLALMHALAGADPSIQPALS